MQPITMYNFVAERRMSFDESSLGRSAVTTESRDIKLEIKYKIAIIIKLAKF